MIIASTGRPIPVDEELSNNDLDGANRDCVGAHVVWQGRARAAERFGVSRHTLWRCLKRGRLGKSLSRTDSDHDHGRRLY